MNDPQRNVRYFKQNDVLRNVGAALAVVGLVWFFFGRTAASYYGPCVMVPVGAIMFIVASARAIPESEVRQNLEKALEGVGRDVTEREELRSRVLKNPPPFCAQGFYFDEHATRFRKGKDAKLFSDVYGYTMLYFTDDALLIRGRRVTLSTGESEDTSLRVEWCDVARAETTPFERRILLSNAKKTTVTARGLMLHIVGRDGELIYRAPIQNDINAEQLCESIAKRCKQGAL